MPTLKTDGLNFCVLLLSLRNAYHLQGKQKAAHFLKMHGF